MKQYEEAQTKRERTGIVLGIGVTATAHLLLLVLGLSYGIRYLEPPPPETAFVIDFSKTEKKEEVIPEPARQGRRPQAEETDKTRPVELVQKSEAPVQGRKANKAPEAFVDDKGDVEIAQPKRETVIDRRALFPAADNQADKDTIAPQTARKISDALKAGHASGNTKTGRFDGEPNAQLKGRNLLGTIPTPSYYGTKIGKVVVTIRVDQYGKVQEAIAGGKGTTVIDKQLWAEARAAAMKAHFNMSAEAPVLQEGTITFHFFLTK